ncbi:hypothetical protein DXG03_007538 [Asterophora parasitica]|uniref:Uncharacterized protein n=1 Tax=Asterophora parasitica TaxID=117018 RepID=A0A9P7G0T0_9AGAR|nr:hypothetical protein DXG03_007538 [Asterophora parasitica]
MRPEAWARLSVLDLSGASITDGFFLRQLLIHCEQLTELFSTVPSLSGIFGRDISLRHLKSLRLESIEHPWVFRSLFTPALSKLNIDFKYESSFDLAAACHMIASSGCSIIDFTCSWSGEVHEDYPYLPDPCEVFMVIPAARRVLIQYIWLDLDVARNLASGEILPRVEQVEWPMDSPFDYEWMIEKRAEWELETYGRLVLKEYWSPVMMETDEIFSLTDLRAMDIRFADLGEKYGISIGEW